MILATLLGAYVDKNVVEKLPKEKFKMGRGIFLFLIALKMIFFPMVD
ncbi:MAG: hypothetical protein ACOC8Y_04270 [Candidatus Natronoplasma sp.]